MKGLVQNIVMMLRIGTVRAAMICAFLSPFVLHVPWASATSQLPDFTYQGQLQQNGQPASGNFDFTFKLFTASSGGSQVGATVLETGFPVTGGLFTVSLAFPGAFTGTQLWLQVTVDGVAMTPRTQISTTPVAQYSLAGAIASHSVTRALLSGTATNGSISLTIPAGHCGGITMNASGAQIGDVVLFSWGSGVTPPADLVFGPLSVTAAGKISTSACNVGSSSLSIASTPVTIQTFR